MKIIKIFAIAVASFATAAVAAEYATGGVAKPEYETGGLTRQVIGGGREKPKYVKNIETSPYRLQIDQKTVQPLKSGDVIKLKKNQSFVIMLDQQLSTGYSWSIKKEKLPHLTVKAELESNRTLAPGVAGGVDSAKVFSFHAKNRGKGTIEFEYKRPWEKAEKPAKVITVRYQIK